MREALEPDLPSSAGTFMVATQGLEDADAWHVVAGAREALEDDDPEYVLMDWPALLVDKGHGRAVTGQQLRALRARRGS